MNRSCMFFICGFEEIDICIFFLNVAMKFWEVILQIIVENSHKNWLWIEAAQLSATYNHAFKDQTFMDMTYVDISLLG